jgi:hypothetical protein
MLSEGNVSNHQSENYDSEGQTPACGVGAQSKLLLSGVK